MPSLKKSLIDLDPKRYRSSPIGTAIGVAQFHPNPAPEPPISNRRSPFMLSSLPGISTNVDGIMRQFYGGRNLPNWRLILPSFLQ